MVSRVVDPGVNMFEGVILYGVSFRGEDKLNLLVLAFWITDFI